ncbi:unnamed protein product [Ambrosiozyma monospora]|uniref:Unnamed protein product n=1 Tax=Ambrosiozyma monospora TaxID=43982 RepID=A0ACB5U6N2_AMBMO|nr:unnamed protein product [Ambrosiozyma monospora]
MMVVERVNVDWTTSQRDYTDVDPVEIEKIRSLYSPNSKITSDVPIYFGKVRTTIVVFGFFKIDKRGQILDAVEVNNPPIILDSKGVWIDIPSKALEMVKLKQLNIAGGIHAAEHAIINLIPLYVSALSINNTSTDPRKGRSNAPPTETSSDDIQTECKAPEKEFAKRQSQKKRPSRLIFHDNNNAGLYV